MAEYRLHCFGQSGNAYKVALMLNLCGADWEPVFVDFFNGATRQPEFREGVNALGEVPVLEFGGRTLSQSGVILLRLAERFGKFGWTSEDEKDEILRWVLFDNHKFTNFFAMRRFQMSFLPTPPDPAVLAFLKGRIDGNLAIVEKHLAAQPFIIGDRPTIADISMAGYMFYPTSEHGYDFAETHPMIAAWKDRIAALPGFAGPYALMPVSAS